MDSICLMMTRLNGDIDEEKANFYIKMAELKIKSYLKLSDDADLSQYLLSIVDLAILYFQKDKSIQNVSDSYGFKSESFSEGGVSESHGAMTGADINTVYDKAIADILAGLDGEAQVVRFI